VEKTRGKGMEEKSDTNWPFC